MTRNRRRLHALVPAAVVVLALTAWSFQRGGRDEPERPWLSPDVAHLRAAAAANREIVDVTNRLTDAQLESAESAVRARLASSGLSGAELDGAYQSDPETAGLRRTRLALATAYRTGRMLCDEVQTLSDRLALANGPEAAEDVWSEYGYMWKSFVSASTMTLQRARKLSTEGGVDLEPAIARLTEAVGAVGRRR